LFLSDGYFSTRVMGSFSQGTEMKFMELTESTKGTL
jgi:hypothetical protein